ncbi:MAG: peroxide stress protein YaaA [Saprospiraceae bacterium]|nr:peroxide stress protein YaaA [Saprospiraceae bacterium]
MIAILSPSKTLDSNPKSAHTFTIPGFTTEIKTLVNILKKKNIDELMQLMNLSRKLAGLNDQRYKSFDLDFNTENSSSTIFTFKGELYLGLKADKFSEQDLDYAQKHLMILSGLYGVLRPLDLMHEYRLEMGTKLKNNKGKNLYTFWGDKITRVLNQNLEETNSEFLINLASNEYFRSINTKMLKAKILQMHFLDEKDGKRRFISFNAKKARGLMAAFMIKNRCTSPEQLKEFNEEGYFYDMVNSDDKTLTFIKY